MTKFHVNHEPVLSNRPERCENFLCNRKFTETKREYTLTFGGATFYTCSARCRKALFIHLGKINPLQ